MALKAAVFRIRRSPKFLDLPDPVIIFMSNKQKSKKNLISTAWDSFGLPYLLSLLMYCNVPMVPKNQQKTLFGWLLEKIRVWIRIRNPMVPVQGCAGSEHWKAVNGCRVGSEEQK